VLIMVVFKFIVLLTSDCLKWLRISFESIDSIPLIG
jgi:hypothetical protein